MSLSVEAPRRSTRRSKPKQYSSYSVGDIVEISRNNMVGRGRLMYKLSEGPTPNPRWLVTFDGQAWKDEELYERSFGKILSKSDDTDIASRTSSTRKGSRTRRSNSSKTPGFKTGNSSSKSSGSSGEDDGHSGPKKKKTVGVSESSVLDSGEDSPPPANMGSNSVSAKVSAREQRSQRRQAMTHEDGFDASDGKKRGRPGSSSSKNGSNNNHKSNKKGRKNEEMVKIPMLTGTLYLYRGLYRRAEFVRRY